MGSAPDGGPEADDKDRHIQLLEDCILDVDRRLRGKLRGGGNPKWIPLHIREAVQDIAARHNRIRAALTEGGEA